MKYMHYATAKGSQFAIFLRIILLPQTTPPHGVPWARTSSLCQTLVGSGWELWLCHVTAQPVTFKHPNGTRLTLGENLS